MHHKNINLIVKRQLKKDHPNWHGLTKKEKKVLAKQVTDAVINDYDFKQEIDAPVEELIGIENQAVSENIISLDEMNALVDDFYKNSLIDVRKLKTFRINLKDSQLKFMDSILDNHIINRLLSYKGFTPCMRTFMPSDFLRAELLKAIKYPEIAYRKFCTDEYLGLDRKENREFIGLPLHKKDMIDHTQLSQFRNSLTFAQTVNLMVYILSHFFRSGILSGNNLHGVDSTELFNDTARPLFTTTIKGKKIRVYEDLDCDCGTRRNKRNKNKYFIGYRMHTLTVIDAQTGHSFPLVSLISPGNHHDSLFLKPLTQLAQAMGIDIKLITADEAYHDKDGSLYEETGVALITPPSADTKLPENVDPENYAVTLDDMCETPMQHLGCTTDGHEYKCNAAPGECPRSDSCPQYRLIPLDGGVFQRIVVDGDEWANQAIEIRKNVERPFNLLKHREGLEQIRVRSQRALITKVTIATMASLLIEMKKRCTDPRADDPQLQIFDFAS
ncbi:MAG: transposase [SAR324 cluster bacterium]|nr:transposase [SAR324 cluster bacterium]